MGLARSSDIDEFLDDADELESNYDALEERRTRKASPKSRHASWRSIEDYQEERRLRRQLSEFYDDFND